VNLLTRATSLYEAAGRPRLDLLVDLGAALFQIGRGSQSLAVLDEAMEAAHAAGELALEWRARLERAYVADEVRPKEAIPLEDQLRMAERAILQLRDLGDDRALARVWRSVTQCRYWLGRNASALEASEHALEYARRAGDVQQETWILRVHTMAFWQGPTPVAEAAQRCRDLLASARNPTVRACALENLGGLVAMQGVFDEARRLVDEASGIYEQLGLPFRAVLTGCWYRADLHFLAGDLASAEAELRRGIEYLDRTGSKAPRSTATALLACVLYDAGRYSEAAAEANRAQQLIGSAETSDYASLTRIWSLRARLMARRGKIEGAKAEIGKALTLAEATDDLERRGSVWMEKADVVELAGEPKEAVSCLERAIDLFEQKGNIVLAGRARAKLTALREEAASSR
jgi:tetratricopeptide (TPR) repeat protein